MEVPSELQALEKKPGKAWSPAERERMRQWWMQRDKLKLVSYCAAYYLGEGAGRQDVEDAVVHFYLLFERVRESYKPGGPGFCTYYLNICFRNDCRAEGKKIRKRLEHERPLAVPTPEQETLELEPADTDARSDPNRQAQLRAFLEDLALLLNGDALPEKQKRVFILRYLEDLSYEEIAVRMQAPVGSVKGWLNRATATARTFLEQKGWSQWQMHP
jgi:RNA polymerase sigma factor (sigma-70 family)